MRQLLPPDIIMEILIWTDIESLSRLRRVCKEWRRLISHPHFMNRHYQKSKNVHGFILDNTSEDTREACHCYDIHFFRHPSPPLSEPLPSLTFMSEPVKIHASTLDGLLLCFGLIRECHYVCKPTTQEWAAIPDPNPQTYTVRMVMSVASTSPLRFRIMRISHLPRRLIFECEIFDSNSDGKWKMMEGVGSLLDGSLRSIALVRDGIVVNGSFYWIEYEGDYKATKVRCVNLWEEEVKTLELPEEVVTEDVNAKLAKVLSNLHGRLGLDRSSCMTFDFEFWVKATSMDEHRWEKIQTLHLNYGDPSALKNVGWMLEQFIVDNTVLINRSSFGRKIFWYNYNEKKYFATNEDNATVSDVRDLHFFKSDYFPCNISECQFNYGHD